ncbi:Stp1/IreP family PP2C-type Ser/Thr phosphatase [Bacillota bacterium]
MGQSACGTDRGIKRAVNEDAMLCIESLGFYMVADGVGGHNSGEIASKLAVDFARQYLEENSPDLVSEDRLPDYIDSFLQWINAGIYEKSLEVKENSGMATTAVMLMVREGKAFIINIGDSRAYIFRKGFLTKITEDHTYVNELFKQGQISKAEAEKHPERNMITRALGSGEKVKPDIYPISVNKGDRILLCTDGLYNELDECGISAIMNKETHVNMIVSELIRLACDRGGRDNITVSCVEI